MAATSITTASAEKKDVHYAINGTPQGQTDSQGRTLSALDHGSTCNIRNGTVTWLDATPGIPNGPITVNKNISIIGAGPGVGGTWISGGTLFLLQPQVDPAGLVSLPRMRISSMRWIRNSTGAPNLKMNGTAPISLAHITDPTQSGGFRVDNIYQTATGAATAQDRVWDFKGWLEGVVDHCIWDFDLSVTGGGESFIINHNGDPTNPSGNGYYSWSTPFAVSDWSQIFIEDGIFKKRGMFDCNQDVNGSAGGARYTARHIVCWGATGNHESRSDGGSAIIGGRGLHTYKNIYVRDGSALNQSGRMLSVRQGEAVSWGNRFELFGAAGGSVSAGHHSLHNYSFSAWLGGNRWGGPDGANEWDLNCFGTLDLGAQGTFVPVDGAAGNARSGSIYAQGTGGTAASGVITFAPGNAPANMANNRWVQFVIRNTDAVRDGETVVSYGYIVSNNATSITVGPPNEPTPAVNTFNLSSGQHWEIRRVDKYFCTTGAGTMDFTEVNGAPPLFSTSFNQDYMDPSHLRLLDGTRRFITRDEPGCSQWDNKFRRSDDPTPYSNCDNWSGQPKYGHTIVNIRNTNAHPGYFYLNDGSTPTLAGNFSGATEVRPDTRVGPDQLVWAMAPDAIKTIPGTHSGTPDAVGGANALLYQNGIGGPQYPHPFVGASVSVPSITSNQSATFASGHAVDCLSTPKANCHKITTSGFGGTPTITVTWTGTTPPNVTFDGANTISGTGAGVLTATTYPATITATLGAQSATPQSFSLTITPNAPPSGVAITLPAANATFTAPATITLQSTASDSDGSIKTIDYYYGGTNLIKSVDAGVVSAPYSYDWTGVAAGSYLLTVKATDNFGASTTSSPAIPITVNPAPTVFSGPTIVVSATADQPPPGPSATATYYVDGVSGSDSNAGDQSAPWKTIQKAMNTAIAGSIVNITGGTYNERLTLGVSGTADNYITFQPVGYTGLAAGGGPGGASIANNGYTTCVGDQVILDYAYLGTVTSDTNPFFNINNKSYVKIQGLTFQNYTCDGSFKQGVRIDGGSHDIQLLNNRFLHNKNIHGVQDNTAALLHIRIWNSNNIIVRGNELGDIVTSQSEALTMDSSSCANSLIESNYIHDTDGIGIDLHGGAHDAIIRGNLLEYISIKRDGTIWYNNASIGIYVDGGNTSVIERNLVRNSATAYSALAEPGQPDAHHIIIRDNVAHNNGAGGAGAIHVGNWYSNTDGTNVHDISVLNNTLYSNGLAISIRPYTSASVVWKNNILSAHGTNIDNSLNWPVGTMDYNLYFGGTAGPDVHKVTTNPLFTNTASTPPDLSLQTTSPAKNAGDPAFVTGSNETDFLGNPRVVGGRVDMGAYEVQS